MPGTKYYEINNRRREVEFSRVMGNDVVFNIGQTPNYLSAIGAAANEQSPM
jgi:hypothetical protein